MDFSRIHTDNAADFVCSRKLRRRTAFDYFPALFVYACDSSDSVVCIQSARCSAIANRAAIHAANHPRRSGLSGYSHGTADIQLTYSCILFDNSKQPCSFRIRIRLHSAHSMSAAVKVSEKHGNGIIRLSAQIDIRSQFYRKTL